MMSAHNRLCKQFFLFNMKWNEEGGQTEKKNGEENYRQKFHSSLELLKADAQCVHETETNESHSDIYEIFHKEEVFKKLNSQ